MSLYKIGTQDDLSSLYQPYVQVWPEGYPPKSSWPSWWKGVYRNTLNNLHTTSGPFFYLPQLDAYCWWGMWHDYPNFLGVFFPYGPFVALAMSVRILFRADTGTPIEMGYASSLFPTLPNMAAVACGGGSIGSFDKLYITSKAFGNPYAYEVDWRTLRYPDGGWKLSSYETDPPTTYGPWGYWPIVNRVDGYIAWGGSTTFNLFRYDQEANIWRRWAVVNLPASVQSATYESRECMWWISDPASNHLVGKLNYQNGKHEIITSLQTEYSDVLKNYLAFDQRRKRVAVLRARPDDQNTGACRWVLDFYRPIIRVAVGGLTDPVPTESVRVGKQISFLVRLIGEVGESIPPYTIYSSLTKPAAGRLLSPVITANYLGKTYVRYLAINPGSERLDCNTTITDGFEPVIR